MAAMLPIGKADGGSIHVEKSARGYEEDAQNDSECDADLDIGCVGGATRELPLPKSSTIQCPSRCICGNVEPALGLVMQFRNPWRRVFQSSRAIMRLLPGRARLRFPKRDIHAAPVSFCRSGLCLKWGIRERCDTRLVNQMPKGHPRTMAAQSKQGLTKEIRIFLSNLQETPASTGRSRAAPFKPRKPLRGGPGRGTDEMFPRFC